MKVSVDHPKENITRIVLDGRLDVAGTQAAEAEFNAAVAAGPNVIVDLGKVPFIARSAFACWSPALRTDPRWGARWC